VTRCQPKKDDILIVETPTDPYEAKQRDGWVGMIEQDLTDVQADSGGYGIAQGFKSKEWVPAASRPRRMKVLQRDGECIVETVGLTKDEWERRMWGVQNRVCDTPGCNRRSKHRSVPLLRPKVARESCDKCDQFYRNHLAWPDYSQSEEAMVEVTFRGEPAQVAAAIRQMGTPVAPLVVKNTDTSELGEIVALRRRTS
jgi:hypothetical protein